MATLLEILRPDFLLRDALLAGLLVGIVCPWVGVYFVMRRIIFLGVALPQVSAAGVALAFLLHDVGWHILPHDVAERFTHYDVWLAATPKVPKLLFAFDSPPGLQPSPTGSAPMIEWARANVAGLEIETLGTAGHHAPEDVPDAMGKAIAAWLTRHRL